MLNNLPQDQAALILERLGEERVARLAEDAPSVSAFYTRCIREMGHETGGNFAPKIPTKTAAWIEVMHNKKEDTMPGFSHRYIERAIMSFGGWQLALAAFKESATIEKAKYKFQFAYMDIVEG